MVSRWVQWKKGMIITASWSDFCLVFLVSSSPSVIFRPARSKPDLESNSFLDLPFTTVNLFEKLAFPDELMFDWLSLLNASFLQALQSNQLNHYSYVSSERNQNLLFFLPFPHFDSSISWAKVAKHINFCSTKTFLKNNL